MICKICNIEQAEKFYCKKCFNKMDYGLIVKINGKWKKSNRLFDNSKEFLNYHNYKRCLVCNTDTDGNILCDSCSQRVEVMEKNYENVELENLKKEFYNTLNSKFIINEDKAIIMFALALVADKLFNDRDLLLIVVDEVSYILSRNIKKKADGYVEYFDETRKSCVKNNVKKTIDGHIVKSEGEAIIDNILAKHKIFHYYEPKVLELLNVGKNVYADWAIPYLDRFIYIEYFGLETKSNYNDRKNEKIKLYELNNIQLITITKNEMRNSTRVEEKLMREIKLCEENIKKSLI